MSHLDSEIAKKLNITPESFSTNWNYAGEVIDALLVLDYTITIEQQGDKVFCLIADSASNSTRYEHGLAQTKERALCYATRRMLRRKK